MRGRRGDAAISASSSCRPFPASPRPLSSPLKKSWSTIPSCLFPDEKRHVENVPHFFNGLLAPIPFNEVYVDASQGLMKNSRRDLEKERFWRQTLERQRKSRKTIREFCEAEGLKDWSLSWGGESCSGGTARSPRRNGLK